MSITTTITAIYTKMTNYCSNNLKFMNSCDGGIVSDSTRTVLQESVAMASASASDFILNNDFKR